MAIVGAILGDIAGSRWEFGRPKDLKWETIDLFTDECEFTDDTVLTVATKRALLLNTPFHEEYHKLGNMYYDCGYGGRFIQWLDQHDKLPYNSYGNGSAMRVSPIVDLTSNYNDLVIKAVDSAACTHNHPEGIKGAIVTAICGWMAKSGASKKEIEDFASKEYPASKYPFPVSMSLNILRNNYSWSVTCQNSVPVAIRCFLDSDDYESFLRNVISLDCDTDTLCAIGGGIAEEFYKKTGFNDEELLRRYLDPFLYSHVAPHIKE